MQQGVNLNSRKQMITSLLIAVVVAGLLSIVYAVCNRFDFRADKNFRSDGTALVIVWELAIHDIDYDLVGDLGPVQVVSPIWFHLDDDLGNIRSDFDPLYLQWAREQGYLVWAVVTNSFDPVITAELLADDQLQQSFAEKIVDMAVKYELDGLNIDFENFHYDYRNNFTGFIAQLAELCREENLTLSVDVTLPSGSEYWSMIYDRAALAGEADYLILMAYDEHYQSSPVAGPVASLPWVEQGLQLVLNEVSSEKIILGVPFYSRLWVLDQSASETTIVNTWTYSMQRASEIIEENEAVIYFDDQAKQNVAEFERDGHIYKMWLEDVFSMRQRLELIDKYNLAGLAGWRRGLETPEIWKLMDTFF
jgi:spore germination protein YaaH